MKKPLFTLTFILFCLATYAQSAFTEATFTAMMNRLQTDPVFFKNEADPGFLITFGNGGSSSRDGMTKFAENNVGLYKRKDSDIKINQAGSTAVATGTVEESFLSKENPSIVNRTYKGQFTYIFSQVNGKWSWVFAQHKDLPVAKFTEATLKQILDDYKKDSKVFFNSYLSEDFRYTNSMGAYQPQKYFLGGTAQSIVTTEILQPIIFQSGDLAVVSGIHQTVRTGKDGAQTTSQDAATYTFERRKGKWMFVASQQNAVAK